MRIKASACGPRLYAKAPAKAKAGTAANADKAVLKTPAWLRRWCKTGLILALLLALSGCGLRMLYGRVPFLVGWEVDSALDLNDEQEDWLDQRLHVALRWHQQQQLPQVAELLRQLEEDLRHERLDAERIQALRARRKDFMDAIFVAIKTDAVHLLSELTDAQVAHMLERSREQMADSLEEMAEQSAEDRRELRFESWLDNVEEFTGKLSPEQRALVRAHADGGRDFSCEQAAALAAEQQLLKTMFEQRQDRAALGLALEQLTVQAELRRDPDYQQAIEHERTRSTAFYLQLWPQLTAKQKRHVLKTIHDWQDDVQAMMRKKI